MAAGRSLRGTCAARLAAAPGARHRGPAHSTLDAERRDGGFDAVFVAVGAHLSKRVDIPAKDAARIVDAVSVLRGVASGERPVIGRRVTVYGGGNTAMDAARVARRLGANDATIVYRRTRAQMPAHEEEAEEAEREGVRINWLRTITAFDGPELTVEAMVLDDSGFPQPTGRFETLAADTVILALGQDTDTGFLRRVPGVEFQRDGTVQVSAAMMTGCPGVFAGGDMVPAERTVTVGVGHGKKAARNIDAWLRGADAARSPKHDGVSFADLNLWYFGDAARRQQPEAGPQERVTGFEEVVDGLSEREATYEARRCLSCGNCCECDDCLGACPEDAVMKDAVTVPVAVKLGPQFSSPGEIALRLDEAGADGLVLFNRFLQPDIDPETLAVLPGVDLDLPAAQAGPCLTRGDQRRGGTSRRGQVPAGRRRRRDDRVRADPARAAARRRPARRLVGMDGPQRIRLDR
jgi:thioredoxin reductase